MAKFLDGTYAEKDIDLKIVVEDVNDCPPILKAQQVGYVNESSATGILRHSQYISNMVLENESIFTCTQSFVLFHVHGWFLGTFVMKAIATDADQENTLHSKIYYRIVEQRYTAELFSINSETGEVTVRMNTLDREVRHFTNLLNFWNSLYSATNSIYC